MERYLKLLNICCLTLFLGLLSCEKFVDRPPLDAITDEGMTFSAREMELYSNKYYGSLPTFGNSYGLGIFGEDQNSDNMVSGDYNFNSRLAGTIPVPTSGGGWSWEEIRGINFFLTNYQRSTEPREKINAYIGEMYFWRAWYYYAKLKNFGDLPWYNKPLTTSSEELYSARLSRSIIADSIIKDLDSAALMLPTIETTAQGRLHRDAALLLQSRVALYEGSWEKYHAGTPFGVGNAEPDKYFEKSADAAKKVIEGGRFAIQPANSKPGEAYWALFNQEDYSAFKDIMLWRKYDMALNNYHFAQQTFVNSANTGLSKALIESYLCTDGKPISVSSLYKGDNEIEELVQNRDPRLTQTMFTRGKPRVINNGDTTGRFTVPDLTLENRLRNTTGYQLFKGLDPAADKNNGNTNGAIIFRYAEVLLNYAEAMAELDRCTQDILDLTVNQLRDRVDMVHLQSGVGFVDPKWDFPEISALLNEIRRERRIELACEGYRFDDLMRWAAANLIRRQALGAKLDQFSEIKEQFQPVLDPRAIAVNGAGYIAPYQYTPSRDGHQFDPDKHYLAPIPINELTLNTNLTQNPGY
uniref:RagB/SusD domain-containing protein n=1 Tax=Sphingobacterium sp. (strain 21) TaxID=743722 RepID=F4CEK1_SPHS2